jgi:hypothetical protein
VVCRIIREKIGSRTRLNKQKRLCGGKEKKKMYFKITNFLIDSDAATAARISNRLDNLYDDLNRCNDSCCSQASKRIRQENFLLAEAGKILTDADSTRSAKAFAGIVYEVLNGFQQEAGEDNDEWE